MVEKKNILITGVCGTIGKSLLSQILNEKKFKSYNIIGIDKDENNLFFLYE